MVKLSDAVQQLPRQTTEFVHGVPNQFLDVGEKKAQQPDSEESRFGRGAYFMGKAVWAKVRRVLQGLCQGNAQAERHDVVVAWTDKTCVVARWVAGVCEPCRGAYKAQQQGLSFSLRALSSMDNTILVKLGLGVRNARGRHHETRPGPARGRGSARTLVCQVSRGGFWALQSCGRVQRPPMRLWPGGACRDVHLVGAGGHFVRQGTI